VIVEGRAEADRLLEGGSPAFSPRRCGGSRRVGADLTARDAVLARSSRSGSPAPASRSPPGRPRAAQAASTFVRADAHQAAHLMQRPRNSASASEPGGRITGAVGRVLADTELGSSEQHRRGDGGLHDAPPLTSIGRCAELRARRSPKCSASSGQSSMQFMQTWHSAMRSSRSGSHAPGSGRTHLPQSGALVDVALDAERRARRDSTPSSAPRGHSTRQKKRGMKRFASRMAPNKQGHEHAGPEHRRVQVHRHADAVEPRSTPAVNDR